MNQRLMNLVAFAAGGTLGFLTARQLIKSKYEQRAEDEIESVKAAFKRMHPDKPTENIQIDEKPTQKERIQYSKRMVELGYTDVKCPSPALLPHVISPDEYGEQDDYERISLTYYADGTLADDSDRAMGEGEVEETVGKESLKHFGEYEDDSVFVRNDRLKADYEILMDRRTYGEILKDKPYLIE